MIYLKHLNHLKQSTIRQISTLSPLGTHFNQKLKLKRNTLLSKLNSNRTGLFGTKELKSYEGFYVLKEDAENTVNRLLNEAFDGKSGRKLVQIFDDISNKLCKVADLAEFVRTCHPNHEYRQAADYTFTGISEIVEKLNTNVALYNKLRQYYENSDRYGLDECDKRVTKLYLIDFEQSGIHLSDLNRLNYVKVNSQLVDLLMKFQINSQLPSKISSNQVDKRFQSLNTTTSPSDTIQVDAMYSNSDNELFREFVYRTYLRDNQMQSYFFDLIVNKRYELSKLCDFKSYSHRANFTTIMETPENINNFLNLLSDKIRPKAINDFNKLREFKKSFNGQEPLMQWDLPYLTRKYKKQYLDLDGTHYREYFSLGCCIEGLNIIVNHLYNVNLEVEDTEPGELWCDNIYKLRVKHATDGTLGFIYCDFFQRENKFSNVDCHYTIQCSKQMDDGSYQLPIVVLHLNFMPSDNGPTLLTFEMMENLFHEFGHAMHSMLARTRYQHVSGTRCSTDFAEVPSQLMEHFCREPKILKLFAKHYQTMKPLSDDIIHKLCESKKTFAASDLQLQILHSMLDQVFHTKNPLGKSAVKIVEEYTNHYYSLPYVNDTYWHLRFSHFIGYGAKYYSYLVSKAIATKLWTECFASDPLNSTNGHKYRYKFLAFGGERKPHELINSLCGFDVNNESLVNSLVDSL